MSGSSDLPASAALVMGGILADTYFNVAACGKKGEMKPYEMRSGVV